MHSILHYNYLKDQNMRKSAMLHKVVLPIFLVFCQPIFSAPLSFQTTRLKSTGGAGVGSILLDEATFLNPASMAFFNLTSIMIQRTGGDEKSDNSSELKSENYAAIMSDTKGPIKGSFSYVKNTQEKNKGSTFGISTAFPIKGKSSIGVTYRRTSFQENGQDKSVNQYVLGASHNIGPSFSLGAILIDPLSKEKNNTLAEFGAQLVYGDFVALMLDVGANYNYPLDESLLYKTALQIMFLPDVYLRAGYFNDKGQEEKGTGVGLGWVQPRLAIEAALKNSKGLTSSRTIRETSFSLSYRF